MTERSVALVLNKETILLTGGTGYIGRMLVKDIVHTSRWGAKRLILPVRDIEKAKNILREEMEQAVSLDVPLEVDMHTGENWYEAK